jgi:hypothetical protein
MPAARWSPPFRRRLSSSRPFEAAISLGHTFYYMNKCNASRHGVKYTTQTRKCPSTRSSPTPPALHPPTAASAETAPTPRARAGSITPPGYPGVLPRGDSCTDSSPTRSVAARHPSPAPVGVTDAHATTPIGVTHTGVDTGAGGARHKLNQRRLYTRRAASTLTKGPRTTRAVRPSASPRGRIFLASAPSQRAYANCPCAILPLNIKHWKRNGDGKRNARLIEKGEKQLEQRFLRGFCTILIESINCGRSVV